VTHDPQGMPPAADIVGWDVRTWARAVEAWRRALARAEARQPGRPLEALELGAGPGGPSLWLTLKGHHVTCTNYDNTELLARPLHERYGVADRITYRDLDVLSSTPDSERYDVIVFKSVLGGLGGEDASRAAAAMAWIRASLRPGGTLLFAENIRGTWGHRLARRIAYRVRGASWRFLPLSELRAHLAGFESVELAEGGVLAVLGTTESKRDVLAKVDQAFLDRIVPRSWHYMAYGSAMKPDGSADGGAATTP